MKKALNVPSSQETASFYDRLMEGKETRGILGKENRYNPVRIVERSSTKKYFVEVVRPYVKSTDRVLDFGCGPGSFLASMAPLCREVVGVDISKNFVSMTQQMIKHFKLTNAQAVHIVPDQLPFADGSFDCVMMVDVIHHLEGIEKSLKEALRVVKKGGRILIFEPNKLNPLLFLVHLIDKNEWGLLKLGTPWKYRKLLKSFMNIEDVQFNGIVIGPESKIYDSMAETLNHRNFKPLLGWLNPKMFITGVKS